ncbi:MAG: O-antigen ligase family protein [Bacteroidales bacterium]|nr:O-antigen ligase family protein [Bacteroidales bacterium]
MKKVLDQFELFLMCVTVFMIPVHIKITSLSIALLLVTAFLKIENYRSFLKLLSDFKFYLFITPLIVAVLGLLNTECLIAARSQIEIVISLLLFPFIFVSFTNNKIHYKIELVLSFFIVGVLFTYIICWAVALPRFICTGDVNVNKLFYTSFGRIVKGPHHLSYSVLFAIVLLSFSLIGELKLFIRRSRRLTMFKLFSLITLVVFLMQLSSKVTILFFILFAIVFLIYAMSKKKFSIKQLVIISVFFVIVSSVLLSAPTPRARFYNLFKVGLDFANNNSKSQESNSLRFEAINAGLHVIYDNFWFGVGTGDIATEMSNYYKANDVQGAYIQHISPHNQFIRTFAMYGIVGFVLLVMVFVMMLQKAIKTRNLLFGFWTLFMIVLFAVEDMLMIQDGIVYFAFFSSLFLFGDELKNQQRDKELII